MSTQPQLAGVLPVFQTPYDDRERIDAETLEKEIAWLFECGADGIVMAMVSEVLRLSSEERRELVMTLDPHPARQTNRPAEIGDTQPQVAPEPSASRSSHQSGLRPWKSKPVALAQPRTPSHPTATTSSGRASARTFQRLARWPTD